MNKALSVCFDVAFKGKGVVNNNRPGTKHGADHLYAKSFPVSTEEGSRAVQKPYVSRNCILHTVLAEPPLFKLLSQSPNPEDKFRVNISKYRMLRGNVDATTGATLQRKSSFLMTDAEPTEDCEPLFDDIFQKRGVAGGGVQSRDWVHNTHFVSSVRIDLDALQFISTDAQGASAAINGDDFDRTGQFFQSGQLAIIWSENYPNTPLPTVQYFDRCEHGKTVAVSAFSTQGFKISDKDTAELVVWFLERLAQFYLAKRDSYLEFDKFSNIEVRTTGDTEYFSSIEELKARLLSANFQVSSSYIETTTPVSARHIFDFIEESKENSKVKKAEAKKARKQKTETADEQTSIYLEHQEIASAKAGVTSGKEAAND